MSGLIYSQNEYPKVILAGEDTVVVFSQKQVKKMAITKIERNMFKELSDSLFNNSYVMKEKILLQAKIIAHDSNLINTYDSLVMNYQYKYGLYNEQIEEKNKDIKRLKRINLLVLIGSGIITLFTIF